MDSKSLTIKSQKEMWWKILICCLLFIGVGLMNSLWTKLDYKPWYEQLTKPAFAPLSSALVGMIWTTMYITMGISIGILWQIAKEAADTEKSNKAKRGIRLFVIQLIVNMIVPIFFFALNNLYFLLIAVLINFILALILVVKFNKINKIASYVLLPFLVWLVYAIVLDGSLLLLNY